MPILVPLSRARMRTHCQAIEFPTCPHFMYVANAIQRKETGRVTATRPLTWLVQTLANSLWVVGIPLGITLIIITALFLTQ